MELVLKHPVIFSRVRSVGNRFGANLPDGDNVLQGSKYPKHIYIYISRDLEFILKISNTHSFGTCTLFEFNEPCTFVHP